MNNSTLINSSPFDTLEQIQKALDSHGDVFIIPDNPYVKWSIRYMLNKNHWDSRYVEYIVRDETLLWDYWTVIPDDDLRLLSVDTLSIPVQNFFKKNKPDIFGDVNAIDVLWKEFSCLLLEITNASIDDTNVAFMQRWSAVLNHAQMSDLLANPKYHKETSDYMYQWLYRDYRSRDIRLISKRYVPFLKDLISKNKELWKTMRHGYGHGWNLMEILPSHATPEDYPFDSSCKILSQAIADVGVVSLDLFERFETNFLTLKNAVSRPLNMHPEREGMLFPWLILGTSASKKIQNWLKKNNIVNEISFYHPFAYVDSGYPEAQQSFLRDNHISYDQHQKNIENAQKVMGVHYQEFADKIRQYYDPLLIMSQFDLDFPAQSAYVLKYDYEYFIELANKTHQMSFQSQEEELLIS